MSEIIDISWPITPGMTTYKDSKIITFNYDKNFARDSVRESSITASCHTGTHIDAPAHFLEYGKTIDKIALDILVGPCLVLDMTHVPEKITGCDLEKPGLEKCDLDKPDSEKSNLRVLIKTKNSLLPETARFEKNFVYLDKSGAQFLADKNVKLVGFDYLGLEREQPEHETHKILFEHNIVLIEGLRLEHVNPGYYFLCCLPLSVQGLEAAPVRAVLLKK